MKYRRVIVRSTGGPEVMRVEEDELPIPGPGQARIKILAADVSFSDVNLRRGRYPGAPRPPFTPGYAMFGVVDQLGPATPARTAEAEAAHLAVGQPVAALTFYGSYSQYLCLPVRDLTPAPEGLDPAEAVCLALNYVAAYQMLHRVVHVSHGARILVHGAGGGVGVAFLEVGRLADLQMFGTASSAKRDLVTRLGGAPIDYRSEDFVARIAAATGGQGVDAAFDPMGAAHLRQSARAVRSGGTVVGYGFYQTSNRGGGVLLDVLSQYLQVAASALAPRRKRVAFYDIRSLAKNHPAWYHEDLSALLDLLATGKLHPVIAARLPLEEASHAHELVERAQVQGKLVLIPNP